MVPVSVNTSGYNTPDSQIESIVQIHPTAARRPHSILVQSENTVYTDEHITAKYYNRNANVVLENGQFTVTPTVQPYEFQTVRTIGKTG
jgi:myo-inositol-1-phosphate synthase